MTNTATYQSWAQMWQRCTNPSDPAWDRYGGRGISVHSRWESFEAFYADMGDKPHKQSLDRVNNDGPYSPENCRWASFTIQNNNRRSNKPLAAFGRTMNIKQWAKHFHINRVTLSDRLKRGWPIEKALSTPVRPLQTC